MYYYTYYLLMEIQTLKCMGMLQHNVDCRWYFRHVLDKKKKTISYSCNYNADHVTIILLYNI